ncbi:hypothetical protein V8D89_002845 [Ganoderma adspersum]
MPQYYQHPMSFYYPVVWYVPSPQSKPSSSMPSPIAQSHRRRHSSSSTPDVHFPSKRLHHSSPRPAYPCAPWPAGCPPTPELRPVPLPRMNDDAYATVDERGQYPPKPQHGRSAARQAPSPSPEPPSVDPFLAVPHHPTTRPPIVWDMMRHPSTAVLDHPSLTHDALRQRPAVRASRADGRQPLRSLVLVFPLLPMEVEIVPSRASLRAGLAYVTIWDVLEGLYYGLRAPISPQELRTLGQSERATLQATAESRRRDVPELEKKLAGETGNSLRRIDYLARRRRFVGMRPALAYERPTRRKLGEVFVVQVGTGAG